jgi:hypothetical protein
VEAMVKKILKNILTQQQLQILREIRNLYYFNIVTRLRSHDLTKLATIYGSDKWGKHFYTTHYSEHFHKLRHNKLKILEIGVGGYENPYKGGASLRMWKRYFPKSWIYSIDIYDKSTLQEKRIKIFQGSQADEAFLKNISSQIGPLDIIIDDGSHIVSHVLTSFKILFPFLKEGGIYVTEDTQTSYWPNFEGNSENLNDPATSMGFFKSLADGLHYREFLKQDYVPSYFDSHIIAVHFYHNLVFIYKGQNNEPSNMVENGKFK